MREVPRATTGADSVQHLLGPAQHVVFVRPALVTHVHDSDARANDLPEHRRPVHDPGVVLYMDRGGNVGHQRAEILGAADDRQQVPVVIVRLPRQLVRDRHLVHGVVPLEQRQACFIAHAVALAVEVRRPQTAGDARERLAVDQNRADDGLFRGDVVGLKTVANQACLRLADPPRLRRERWRPVNLGCAPSALIVLSGLTIYSDTGERVKRLMCPLILTFSHQGRRDLRIVRIVL